jgi:hypothetical protein
MTARMRVVMVFVLVACARTATAQTGAYVSLGPSAGANIAISDQLSNTRSLGIAFRIPRPEGISFAWDLGSQSSDFTDPALTDAPIGTLTVRMFLAGIAYARRAGRLETVLTLTAGFASVGFELSEAGLAAFAPRYGPVTAHTPDNIAAFPKVTLWIDLTNRFGLTFSGGYVLARPTMAVGGPGGGQDIKVNADTIKINGGLVIKIF